jgi:hypothetical protein
MDITKLSLVELKALAYELLVQSNQNARNLAVVEERITQLLKAQSEQKQKVLTEKGKVQDEPKQDDTISN